MLRTKSIKAPIETHDGLRLSVMSRHTLSDGVTPDPEISSSVFDEWWVELAPPARLVGAHYRNEVSWDEFAVGYTDHLRSGAHENFLKLIKLALLRDVTVMCVEATPDFCHRRLLAEAATAYEPNIQTNIR